MLDESMLTASG